MLRHGRAYYARRRKHGSAQNLCRESSACRRRDPPEFIDVEVRQLARCGLLAAAWRGFTHRKSGGLMGGDQRRHGATRQKPSDGRPSDSKVVADAVGGGR